MVDVAPLPATTPFMFHSVEHTHGSFSFTSLLFSTSSCFLSTKWSSLTYVFHHLFWVVRITDCGRSSCALTSHSEQPPPGSRLCSWLPLPSAASDCTASLTKPLQMHLGHRHLSGGTTVKSRNWKNWPGCFAPIILKGQLWIQSL